MGHREDLLDGAADCLYTKGFGRTTARDVVAVSGTNLASIGYHFGSKDALLTEAAVRSAGEWAGVLDAALGRVDPTATPDERVQQTWRSVVDLFHSEHKLWISYVESLAEAARSPRLHDALVGAQRDTREELASMFHALPDDPREADHRSRVLGGFYQALLTGLMVQWVVDPDTAPTGDDVAEALRMLVGSAELA
ncbi:MULTISPECIES: TetR/AcrR family transcriptional regulator [Pseudonocardia]|jgi:AcrR family transcriptional regulator|uniref:Transcriptional regulator, TetR family n=1 Tax=Pseudonocardia oroxyli TaxID=366584 RepID=A0A1G7UU36_PSEOR|nr:MULTISPECIES: TetR/AcrR family transcriptional regulator [Pseudonocardia]MCF7551638.1 TetR/AcrR family transcriptional regulator [Pseudonocardia sp. WMMC193]SDG50250.1 transcriptional regulator, TetR family [Pseudonocardia oroxyli]